MAAILKIYFSLLLLNQEPKGQQTRNLVGSIVVTCRSKQAKIVSIGNPWRPSWKSIFFLLLLNRKGNWLEPGQEALEWLVARIVPIGNPRFPPIWPSWKSIFHFFSWIVRPTDSNLEGSIEVAGRSRKATFQLEIQDGRHGGHFENLFSLLLLNRKASWLETW